MRGPALTLRQFAIRQGKHTYDPRAVVGETIKVLSLIRGNSLQWALSDGLGPAVCTVCHLAMLRTELQDEVKCGSMIICNEDNRKLQLRRGGE